MIKKIFISVLFSAGYLLHAQEFNYIHYDPKDGLGGSTVYNMCQDKNGFIWFATENGLSRYDGTRFKNFTVADGLPDNEVLMVYADSHERIWISTFNKEVCYFRQGKIYTKKNDSLLAKINLSNFLSSVSEDDNGVVALSDASTNVIIIEGENPGKVSLKEFTSPVTVSTFYSCTGKKISAGDQMFNGFLFEKGRFEFFYSSKDVYDREASFKNTFYSYISCDGKVKRLIERKPNYTTLTTSGKYNANRLSFCSTLDGAWALDSEKNEWVTQYLKGKKVSYTMEDIEGNIWFSTMGEGVYRLSSKEIRTVLFPPFHDLINTEVFSIGKYGAKIIAGLNHGVAAYLEKGEANIVNYSGAPNNIYRPQTNRLYSLKILRHSPGVILGFDLFLVKISGPQKLYSDIYPVKSVEEIDSDFIMAGTSSYVFKMRLSDLAIADTIWKERSTKLFYFAGKYYIGTLSGLYEVNRDKSFVFLGTLHHALTRRVTDMKAGADSTLWIATADEGIVALKNGKITAVINEKKGITSNICRTLFLQHHFLWAGTNKGLNKIDISQPAFPVIKYSSSDGLPSDIINAVYAEDSIVYVGSPAGLTSFNENKISASSVCKLNILDITVAGQPFDSSMSRLPHKQNNIRFEFVAISLKSAGDITYFYKLNGLGNEWRQTTQTTIEYPALPGGEYEFILYAVNKFGVKSDTITVKFSVQIPFWKAGWFYGLLALFTAGIAGWLVNGRNKKINKKLEGENALQKQFAALEQLALQSQMNPHFIFNCLNGIQQYILTDNKEMANQYLTGFARLIRQTLDNSGKKSITVAQEMQYLKEYLEMEKMRTGDIFDYQINNEIPAGVTEMEVPAMLLQPYVENAIRHGIRYKTDGKGLVKISFAKNENYLVCTITDNGIGREKAAAMKSTMHIEYQSRGMSLTSRRIDLLNRINDTKMSVEVTDLYTAAGMASGTQVKIQIPVN
ncbi:MAG: histidine kinase [Ferruginibacter sp.]